MKTTRNPLNNLRCIRSQALGVFSMVLIATWLIGHCGLNIILTNVVVFALWIPVVGIGIGPFVSVRLRSLILDLSMVKQESDVTGILSGLLVITIAGIMFGGGAIVNIVSELADTNFYEWFHLLLVMVIGGTGMFSIVFKKKLASLIVARKHNKAIDSDKK